MTNRAGQIDAGGERGENLANSGLTPNLVAGGVGFFLPQRTRQLLWVCDSTAPKPGKRTPDSVQVVLRRGFQGDVRWEDGRQPEPSTIYLKESVSVPKNANLVIVPGGDVRLGPGSYEGRTATTYPSLTSEQRWVYLNWLQDPTRVIHPEYLNLYYLGLERHLLLGDFDEAYAEVMELRTYHSDGYFLEFSANSLLASSAIRNRPERATELLSHLRYSDFSSGIRVVLVSRLGLGLSADDIVEFSCSRQNWQNKPNTRYLDAYPDLFREVLRKLLLAHYGQEFMPLPSSSDLLDSVSEYNTILYQNCSFPEETSLVKLPDIRKNQSVRTITDALMAETHRAVKTQVAQERRTSRRREGGAAVTPRVPGQSQVSCPVCGYPLGRGPAGNTTCPHCRAELRLRKDPDTSKRILVTVQQSAQVDARREALEAQRRVEGIIGDLGLSVTGFIRLQETVSRGKVGGATAGDILLPMLEERLKRADASQRRWEVANRIYWDTMILLRQEGRNSDAFNCCVAAVIIGNLEEQGDNSDSDAAIRRALPAVASRSPSAELLNERLLQDLARKMGTALRDALTDRLPFIVKCILSCSLPLSSDTTTSPTDAPESVTH